ncbi:MAG: hypothetical protein ACK4PR_03295, partial [Gammaproteobacteria bacterium]
MKYSDESYLLSSSPLNIFTPKSCLVDDDYHSLLTGFSSSKGFLAEKISLAPAPKPLFINLPILETGEVNLDISILNIDENKSIKLYAQGKCIGEVTKKNNQFTIIIQEKNKLLLTGKTQAQGLHIQMPGDLILNAELAPETDLTITAHNATFKKALEINKNVDVKLSGDLLVKRKIIANQLNLDVNFIENKSTLSGHAVEINA